MAKPYFKNSGLCLSFSTIMSLWVHKFFKRMISSSNFVVIARVVILARKDPLTSPLHIIFFSRDKLGSFQPDQQIGCWRYHTRKLLLQYWCKWHCQSYRRRNRLKFPHVNWTYTIYLLLLQFLLLFLFNKY